MSSRSVTPLTHRSGSPDTQPTPPNIEFFDGEGNEFADENAPPPNWVPLTVLRNLATENRSNTFVDQRYRRDPFEETAERILLRQMEMRRVVARITDHNTMQDIYDYGNGLAATARHERFTPMLFMHPPSDSNGNLRQPRMTDIEAAILDLASSRVPPGALRNNAAAEARGMLRHLKTCSYVVVRMMGGLCSRASSTLPFIQFPNRYLKEFIMQTFCDLISLHKPRIPIEECDNLWILRYLLQRDWNNFAYEARRRHPLPQERHRFQTRIQAPDGNGRPYSRIFS